MENVKLWIKRIVLIAFVSAIIVTMGFVSWWAGRKSSQKLHGESPIMAEATETINTEVGSEELFETEEQGTEDSAYKVTGYDTLGGQEIPVYEYDPSTADPALVAQLETTKLSEESIDCYDTSFYIEESDDITFEFGESDGYGTVVEELVSCGVTIYCKEHGITGHFYVDPVNVDVYNDIGNVTCTADDGTVMNITYQCSTREVLIQ